MEQEQTKVQATASAKKKAGRPHVYNGGTKAVTVMVPIAGLEKFRQAVAAIRKEYEIKKC